jgi:hypothetical protein
MLKTIKPKSKKLWWPSEEHIKYHINESKKIKALHWSIKLGERNFLWDVSIIIKYLEDNKKEITKYKKPNDGRIILYDKDGPFIL